LKPIFADIVHRHRIGRLECDLLIPSLKVVIQYDGAHFHRDKSDKDELNTTRLEKLGFIVFRFRDRSLPAIRGTIPFTEKGELKIGEIKRLLGEMLGFGLSKNQSRMVQCYLKQNKFWKDEEFLTLSAQIPGPMPGTSLVDLFPELVRRWDHSRNGQLTPDKVTPRSNLRVYWICEKGHSHQGTIGDRARGIGCPFCQRLGSKYTLPEDSLSATNPDLASEWHPTQNGDLTPTCMPPNSSKSVWWICSADPTHEWQATVSNRNGRKSGCPYCTGKRVDPKHSLAAVNPRLVAEWHPRRNGNLRSDQVTPFSKRKVWWQCSALPQHEWEATISNRHERKSGCPHCYAKSSAKKS